MRKILLITFLAGAFVPATPAENWPRLRGINGSGVVDDVKIPAEWSESEFRWQIEELRISLFSQELKTPQPVSVKRLEKLWERVRK